MKDLYWTLILPRFGSIHRIQGLKIIIIITHTHTHTYIQSQRERDREEGENDLKFRWTISLTKHTLLGE